MPSIVFESALERLMVSGVPGGMARAISTETNDLLGPFRSVKSSTTSPFPTTPSMGDSYITISGQFATQIAMFGGDGIWHYSVPYPGDLAYVQDTGIYIQFLNGAWSPWGRGALTWADFGAVGNGIANDTAAMQRGFNYPGQVNPDSPGKTYLVYKTGTKQLRFITGTLPMEYCLTYPSNCSVSWLGSTIKMANGQNACVLVPAAPGLTTTFNVTMTGGTIDGNQANQDETATGHLMPNMHFGDNDTLRLENISSINARQYCGFFPKTNLLYFNNMKASFSRGEGFSIGFQGAHVSNSFIDNVYCELIQGDINFAAHPGNPVIGVFNNCVLGKLMSRNCGGGFKFQHDGQAFIVQSAVFDGTVGSGERDNATSNSGLKIQGQNDITPFPNRIIVGSVVSINAGAEGLALFEDSTDCVVQSYTGSGNGRLLGGTQDIYIGGKRHVIGILESGDFQDPTGSNIFVAGPSDGVSIGQAKINNTLGKPMVISATGQFNCGELEVKDPNTSMVWPAFSVTNTTTGGLGNTILPVPPTNKNPFDSSGSIIFSFGSLQMSTTDGKFGTITLADGATSTTLANGNLQRNFIGNFGGIPYYIQASITFTPISANAKTLGRPGYALRDAAGGAPQTGAVLSHAMTASPSLAVYNYQIGNWFIGPAFT